MKKGYVYIRFRWWNGADLSELSEKLNRHDFQVEKHVMPRSDEEISLMKGFRDHLHVKAVTLGAILEPYKAILFQKDTAPFTKKDMKLREIVMESYPRNSPTIWPLSYSYEPDFEKEEKN